MNSKAEHLISKQIAHLQSAWSHYNEKWPIKGKRLITLKGKRQASLLEKALN